MGNSGSIHHIQSGLKELHSYYNIKNYNEIRNNCLYLNEESASLDDEQKYPGCENSSLHLKMSRTPSNNNNIDNIPSKNNDLPAKNSQVKVLPSLTEHLKLRSTTNGAILQSGGTISGKKDSHFHPRILERSKTYITDNCIKKNPEVKKHLLSNQRSQTQINISLDRKDTSHTREKQLKANNDNINTVTTSFQKSSKVDQNIFVCNIDETYQKISIAKLKNKKRKAPSAPVSLLPRTGGSKALNLPSSHYQTQEKVNDRKERFFKRRSETPVQSEQKLEFDVPKKCTSPARISKNLVPSTETSLGKQCSFFPRNISYRRKKSFDVTLLLSQNDNPLITKKQTRKIHPTTSEFVQLTPITSLNQVNDKSNVKLPGAIEKNILPMKKIGDLNYKLNGFLSTHSKTTLNNKLTEVSSKIPQLKRTFYFGMGNSKIMVNDASHNVSLEANEIKWEKNGRKESPIYFTSQKQSNEIYDNGILVNVRPILPRRQLEIPRFSPVAAWRTLSGSSSTNLGIESGSLLEEKIHRIYREPCPLLPDNKSGDSGISGDEAFLTEKPIQPRNIVNIQDELHLITKLNIHSVDDMPSPLKKVGPFLSPWTPQQDLEDDEEETSSDGDEAVEICAQIPSSGQVFSFSLPRENPFSLYGDKKKSEFRSLQKLKSSLSGEQNHESRRYMQHTDMNVYNLSNYHNDNWVLSKSGITCSSDKTNAEKLVKNHTNLIRSNEDLHFSRSIQHPPLVSLTTGKRIMYLPNRLTNEYKRQSLIPQANRNLLSRNNLKTPLNKYQPQSQTEMIDYSTMNLKDHKLGEKPLAKLEMKKDYICQTELDIMRMVEEEFQMKRAYEKESIRHQLQLYSLNDNLSDVSQNCTELNGATFVMQNESIKS